jgi:hypothetical protein
MKAGSSSVSSTACGAVCIFAALATGCLWFLNYRARTINPDMHDLSPLKLPAIILAILGIALLLRWKPAMLFFVATTAAFGTVLILGSLWQSIVQTPWVLLNIPIGAILLVPLALAIHTWKTSPPSLTNGQ